MTSLIDAALAYAAKGIPIFPVGAGKEGKAPLTENGFHDASTDPETISAWWRKHPRAKIGMPCGRASGMIVVDIDCHPGKPSGFEHLPHWAELSDYIVKTAGGGRHLYFADDGKTAIAHPFPGVETRGEGHYVILPGSPGYEIERGGDLKDLKSVPVFLLANRRISSARSKASKKLFSSKPAPDWPIDRCEREHLSLQPEFVAEAEAWIAELKRAYEVMPNDDLPWDEWSKRGAALHNATCGAEAGRKIFEEWSAKSKKHSSGAVLERWRHWDRSPYTDIYAESIFYWAWEAAGDFWWREESSAPEPEPTAKAPEWPVLGAAAYHGIIGEVVRTIEPETEADPVAILVQLIVAVGSMIGRRAYYQVESDRHHPNLFAAAVGDTSKARKGTSWGRVRGVSYHADSDWVFRRIGSGLSSGEGLIHQVRDQVTKTNKDGEEEIVDAGVSDKRFMALEAELSGLLKVMERPGNTISPLFRKAWDGGDLQTLTRNNALKATAAHISTIGHITIEKLRSCLTQTDAANGFANRFLFFLVRRSKELPMGGNLDERVIEGLGRRIGAAIDGLLGFRDEPLRVKFSPEGEARWREIYGRLTKGHPGLFGAVTARGEAQVIRVALIYAVLDKSDFIELPHIEGGLAVWDYCERSARHIFGEMLGDNVADTILSGLKQAFPEGMSRTEIFRDLFGNHARSSAIAAALAKLKVLSLAKSDTDSPRGPYRPTEIWTYMPPT